MLKKIEQAALAVTDGFIAERGVAGNAGEFEQPDRGPVSIPVP